MSKIIIECKVPAAGIARDVAIPYEKPLMHSFELIKAIFSENESFSPDSDSVLCDTKTGTVLEVSKTPEELGLVNGASVMIV